MDVFRLNKYYGSAQPDMGEWAEAQVWAVLSVSWENYQPNKLHSNKLHVLTKDCITGDY